MLIMAAIADYVGMLGVVILLVGYFLFQCGKISPTGFGFSLYNLVGALLILFSLFFAWNLSAFVIEAAWVFISLFGIARILWKRRKI